MSRPFASFGIEKLKGEFERSKLAGDTRNVKRLQAEVKFRTVPKAKALAKLISAWLGEDDTTRRQDRRPSRPNGRKPARKPTPEQEEAIGLFGRGGSLKINAFAGAGKTSTLEMLAQSSRAKGQYLAFNRDIVKEARTASRHPSIARQPTVWRTERSRDHTGATARSSPSG